jgi:fatty acid CoA ligase FadD22
MTGNLAAALERRVRLFGWQDRPLFHTDDRTYTHGAVQEAAARAAGVLHGAGVRTGHRVLIALPDSVELVAALLGTLRLGALAVLMGPEQSAEEHAYVLDDAGPGAVVCPAALAGRFPGVQVLTAEDLADEPAEPPPPAAVPPGAPAYVQYTSGTTGPPKGAVHRHSDPRAYVEALALGALGVTAEDVLFSVSKACYPYGLGNTVFFPMFCGASAVLWPGRPVRGAGADTGPDPAAWVAEVCAQAARHKPTLLFAVPGFYQRLVATGDRAAFGALRAATSAAEPLLPTLADRVEEFLACPLLDGLGTTEVGHTFISNTVARRARGSLGLVLDPYEISVRAGGREAAAGEKGLLHVRGPSVLVEYLGRPEQTAEVLAPTGWLSTGDLVHVDADGFVYHHGRAADLEIVGGTAVLPVEVERVLGEHPAVGEVAVVGEDLPNGDTVLRAFVVCDEAPPESDLLEFARARLRPAAVPATVTVVAALPRSRGGKLQRSALLRLSKDTGAWDISPPPLPRGRPEPNGVRP